MPNIQINVGVTVAQVTLQYNARKRTIDITDGLTVKQAFEQESEGLGLDTSRPVTYSRGGETVPGNAALVAGSTYKATVSFEAKGSK